jgi:hypothetical protein
VAYPTILVEAAFTVGGAFGTALILDSATVGILDTNTLSAEVWTDITAYALSFNTGRGASRADGPVLRFEAGHATVTLDNSDRRFDPTNLSGPYVAGGRTQVEPMRKVRISAVYDGTALPGVHRVRRLLGHRLPGLGHVDLRADRDGRHEGPLQLRPGGQRGRRRLRAVRGAGASCPRLGLLADPGPHHRRG